MCGIAPGKSQSPREPSSSLPSSAQTFAGILEPNSTAPLAAAARPKKLRRDNAAMSLEGEVILILSLLSQNCLLLISEGPLLGPKLRQQREFYFRPGESHRGLNFLGTFTPTL